MKKLVFLLLLAALLAFTACQNGQRGPATPEEMTAFEKIQRSLLELQNYRAIATVEFHSNKGVNVYETIQHAKNTGEYRIEVTGPDHVSGSVTAFDGQQILQFNSRVSGNVSMLVQETPERSEIFLTTFIQNYLQSAEISVSVSDMGEGLQTILEATVPGDHPYLSTSRLWVDNNTLLPVRLVVLDQDGKERIVVTYSVIEFNVEMDPSIFTL